jgi:protein-L-isoaspartate(D-aspartate) O-methyltransferase
MSDPRFEARRAEREWMVRTQLEDRCIRDPAVLEAFRRVPREEFLPPDLQHLAYADEALPIELDQTISQPFIVALMAEAAQLRGGERVLEIGAGSGYAAAILASIAGVVFTVERHEELAATASRRLRDLGFANVRVRFGDGTLGWPEHAPYDAILVAATAPRIPTALVEQLAPGGRLVLPCGERHGRQELVRASRTPDGRLVVEHLDDVRFVPLIGEQGFEAEHKTVRELANGSG